MLVLADRLDGVALGLVYLDHQAVGALPQRIELDRNQRRLQGLSVRTPRDEPAGQCLEDV